MEEKKFNCKMEAVPVVTGFALQSMENDKVDFMAYSPVFADPFMADIQSKQTLCMDLIKSSDVVRQQKAITKQISQKLGEFRVSLNPVEGYLKLAGKTLDIEVADFGLNNLRTAISKGDVEGFISDAKSLFLHLNRNEAALQAKGMRPETVATLTIQESEIRQLNLQQNDLKNRRTRVANDNIKDFNDLWDMLGTILNAGRAMYRGVDDAKLKEYTLANLLKRVHNESGAAADTAAAKTDTPA
jgi:hypothetical protein